MGKLFLREFEYPQYCACKYCNTPIAGTKYPSFVVAQVIERLSQELPDRSFFRHVINVVLERSPANSPGIVRAVHCVKCNADLGWISRRPVIATIYALRKDRILEHNDG